LGALQLVSLTSVRFWPRSLASVRISPPPSDISAVVLVFLVEKAWACPRFLQFAAVQPGAAVYRREVLRELDLVF